MATGVNTRRSVLFWGSVYRCQGILKLPLFTQLLVFLVVAGPNKAGG